MGHGRSENGTAEVSISGLFVDIAPGGLKMDRGRECPFKDFHGELQLEEWQGPDTMPLTSATWLGCSKADELHAILALDATHGRAIETAWGPRMSAEVKGKSKSS